MTCKHTIGIEYERCGSNDGFLFESGYSFCHNHENWLEDENSSSANIFSFCPDCGKKLTVTWRTHQFANGHYKTEFTCETP